MRSATNAPRFGRLLRVPSWLGWQAGEGARLSRVKLTRMNIGRASLLAGAFALTLLFPARAEDARKNEMARQMFEQLFVPPGTLPVQDLVAEGDELEAEGADDFSDIGTTR